MRGLEVGALGALLCEVGVEACGVGGAGCFDARDSVLDDFKFVFL